MYADSKKNNVQLHLAFFTKMVKKRKGNVYNKMSDSDCDEVKWERQYVRHRNDSNYSR